MKLRSPIWIIRMIEERNQRLNASEDLVNIPWEALEDNLETDQLLLQKYKYE